MVPKRPQYDPQNTYDGGQLHSSQKPRRPHFDPQNSHDETHRPLQWQHQEQRPTIPAPQFSNFDLESVLPLTQSGHDPSISLPQKANTNQYHTEQHLHQGSISPIKPVEQDLWASHSKAWDSQAAYLPSPEQQHATLVHHDRQSVSTTDFSSITAGKSTPESQQTSNTSYRGVEDQGSLSKENEQADDSFYWHSGRSSSDVGDDHSQSSSPVATPEASVGQRSSATNSTIVQREHRDLPARSTSLSPSVSAHYGASALGFGGPSDWEYFGDYEAEEIDDEELYSRPRPQNDVKAYGVSAELSAERPENPLVDHSEAGRSSKTFTQDPEASGEGDYATDTKALSKQGPATPRPQSSNPIASLTTSPEQRPDLDEVIRAWSEAPYVGKTKAESPHPQVKEEDHELSRNVDNLSSVSVAHEKVVGADTMPEDALSMPALSAPANDADPLVEQSRHKNEAPQVPLNVSPEPQDSRGHKHETCLVEQSASNNLSEHVRITCAEAEPLSISQTSDAAGSAGREPSSTTMPIPPLPLEATSTPIEANKRSVDFENATGIRDMIMRRSDSMPRETSYTPIQTAHQNVHPISMRAASPLKNLPQKPSSDEKPNDLKDSNHDLQVASTSLRSNETVENVPTNGDTTGAGVFTEQQLPKEDTTKEAGQPATSTVTKAGVEPSSQTSPKYGMLNDPYADLDPWGKASLNRFAAMLREESRAESNKDKLNIFNVFTSRESRLRVVLYGTEDELVNPPKNSTQEQAVTKEQDNIERPSVAQDVEKTSQPEKGGFVKQAVQRVNTMTLQRSLKALPALPANRDSVIGLPGNALAPLVVQEHSKPATAGEGLKSKSPLDEEEYSPGGRPIGGRLPTEDSRAAKEELQKTTATSAAVAGSNHPQSPSSNAPIATGPESEVTATKQPAYTPPKYNEPRSEVKNYLANRKSIIRPYSTLRQSSTEGGSTFGKWPDVEEVPMSNVRIAAPTSHYSPASRVKDDDGQNPRAVPKSSGIGSQPDLRRFVKADFDPLLAILPDSEASIPEPPRLHDLRSVMENVPDDFSFIHQSVVAWDVKARKQREENDRQRHARQIESEQRIDSLFDDHEIGYGDISELESEFKRSEAARKADEDRSEYQMFVSDVFTLVWTRLHYELDQLIPHYEQYSSLMNDTLAGKDMFVGSPNGLALAPTMSLFLTLHQKLEIRHQKAFEAVLERDRRLKKTEISPWYTLSNIAKVKQLEKQFEDAEKKAIIEYCQQRDVRANRLMDVLDQNTLRGVGANQDYMEAIMKAVRRIASGRAFASVSGPNEPTAGMEEVEKAKAVTALLAASSEQIVQTFHVADMLLNSADYEVSVAKAKVADKADLGSLATLKEERNKEDQKLMRDLEHRLALIREDTRRTNDEIVKLMLFLGITNARADSAPATHAGSTNPEHEARIQKALEEAKKRNANRESVG